MFLWQVVGGMPGCFAVSFIYNGEAFPVMVDADFTVDDVLEEVGLAAGTRVRIVNGDNVSVRVPRHLVPGAEYVVHVR